MWNEPVLGDRLTQEHLSEDRGDRGYRNKRDQY
jgi:hypothetical protein